ncbi:MAG: DUF5106 domain-containing protein [Muribaculaceae bacterium]|nr:DUF5106 domain-containing protein [Muribaculaceae bacterium]
MKKLIFAIALLLSFFNCVSAQDSFFQYPTPPESIEGFYPRVNYMVEHFWDRCDMKGAFSSRPRLKSAFEDYMQLVTQAQSDTAMTSIDNLIKRVRKADAKNILTLGSIAREVLYSDSAYIFSEQLYLPFAQAVAQTNKISSADRAPFEYEVGILSTSQVGMTLPDITFTRPDGTKGALSDAGRKRLLLMFSDPECDECRMLAVMQSADTNLRQLHEKGFLQLVVLYPGDPTDDWKRRVADYPAEWIVGANPDLDTMFALDVMPNVYYLSPKRKILAKNLDTSRLFEMYRMLNLNVQAPE